MPPEVWSIAADLEKILDLTDVLALTVAGLSAADLVRPGHALTHQIGEAAHEQGVQAIRSLSATGVDEVLALFPENLASATLHVELVEVWASRLDLSS